MADAERRSGAGGAGDDKEFYLRYYVGHKGKFGHEFMEFEFRPDGKLRYANNSNYRNDKMIRKEGTHSIAALDGARVAEIAWPARGAPQPHAALQHGSILAFWRKSAASWTTARS